MSVRPRPAVLASILASIAVVVAVLIPTVLLPSSAGADLPAALTRLLPGACARGVAATAEHCQLELVVDAQNRPLSRTAPVGYRPADLQAAYGLTGAAASQGTNQTVAVIEAYDDPTAEHDLGVYRSTFGLPACTTANGCFRKVNQRGVRGSYPANDTGWATEASLDVDMVSAACPRCHIMIVEADSADSSSLYAGVDEAVRLGAHIISMSWGGAESNTDPKDAAHFKVPHTMLIASSGDSGYGVQFPASAPTTVAVGGTSLTRSGSGFRETVWRDTGSGCSAYEPKPSWERDRGCAHRTVADVAVDADPRTGVAVYDTDCTGLQRLLGNCFSGWAAVGGTSVGAPFIGGVYGLAGNATSVSAAAIFAHPGALHDVTSGSDGSCGGSYLCTAKPGYDGPTGLGTPNGTGAF